MLKSVTLIFLFVVAFDTTSARQRRTSGDGPETWTGRWFPERPVTQPSPKAHMREGEAVMGEEDPNCDDAKQNLTVDWNNSFLDYTCMNPRNRIVPNREVVPVIEYESIPAGYEAPHFCMNETLIYESPIPTFGPHRPLWPRWGLYKFLPKQRWLHSLEHGGVAALYHPCADIVGISEFKKLVKNCLRKHVISPMKDISFDRPFVLVAWGVRLRMAAVNPTVMYDFIRNHGVKGPEMIPDDGQYSVLLEEPAAIVSDITDSKLCPNPPAQVI